MPVITRDPSIDADERTLILNPMRKLIFEEL